MKSSSPNTAAAATDIPISRLPISMSWPLAFMFTDQISDFIPRWTCSPISASPRTKGSFQKGWT